MNGERGGTALAVLCGTLCLYGFLSAPAPPVIRTVEVAVGLGLAVASGLFAPLAMAAGPLRAPAWRTAGVPALLLLAWLPLLRGVWLGWPVEDILRDLVPLLYLFLPLFVVPRLRHAGPYAVRALVAALALAGLFFALRWWRHAHWGFGAVGTRAMAEGALYVLNAPSVLFAGIALPVAALALLRRGGSLRWAAAALLLAGGAVCLGALAGAVHRLALGLALPALAGVLVWHGRRTPWILLLAGLAAVALLLLLGDMLAGALWQVAEKNRLAGGNARWEEAAAAAAQAAGSVPAFLLGEGWGGLLANPAVGGWRVSYTHTLPSYLLLKTGTLGLAAAALWLGTLAPLAWRLLRSAPPLAAAVLPPLVVALGAHTSFKYLDTGVLLTLIVLASETAPVSPRREPAKTGGHAREDVARTPPLPDETAPAPA